MKPSLYNKAIDNVVKYTRILSTMNRILSEDFDLCPKSKSEISSNKNHSANGSCVDFSTNCNTDSTI